MRRLGYDRYAAQGGDIGAFISLALAGRHPEHVVGVHVNMLVTLPPGDQSELADLSESDQARLGRMVRFVADLSGYMKLQSTRPQTLSYGLTDSPVGQLAWVVEKFREWTDSAEVPEDAVDRDQLLTNVTIYWLTATAGSSAQIYVEGADLLPTAAVRPSPPPLAVPLGVAVFPHDIVLPIRRLADLSFPEYRALDRVRPGRSLRRHGGARSVCWRLASIRPRRERIGTRQKREGDVHGCLPLRVRSQGGPAPLLVLSGWPARIYVEVCARLASRSRPSAS
jgi:pimeloyl-ACP methyl ester carboxylesterase